MSKLLQLYLKLKKVLAYQVYAIRIEKETIRFT